MKHKICRWMLVALGAAALTGCGSAPTSGSRAQADADSTGTTATPQATSGAAGVKAFIDPVTGELREPTESEQRAATAAAGTTAVSGTAGVKAALPIEGKPLGNGMVEYDLGKRGMIDEVACVQPDGSVSGNCPKSVPKAVPKATPKADK
jgi:hypothetical protein